VQKIESTSTAVSSTLLLWFARYDALCSLSTELNSSGGGDTRRSPFTLRSATPVSQDELLWYRDRHLCASLRRPQGLDSLKLRLLGDPPPPPIASSAPSTPSSGFRPLSAGGAITVGFHPTC
jgi:hypothetical protein